MRKKGTAKHKHEEALLLLWNARRPATVSSSFSFFLLKKTRLLSHFPREENNKKKRSFARTRRKGKREGRFILRLNERAANDNKGGREEKGEQKEREGERDLAKILGKCACGKPGENVFHLQVRDKA